MRLPVRLLLAVGVCSFAAPTWAEPPAANVRLAYTADPGCPDRAAFMASVRARTPLARFDDQASGWGVSVTAQSLPLRDAGTSRGTVHAEGAEPREVSAANCEDVVTALALILALAIDPGALATPGAPPAAETAPVATEPPPAPVVAAPVLVLPPLPLTSATSVPSVPSRGPDVYWGFGAAFDASAPLSSEWTRLVGPAVSAELGARWTPLLAPSLELTAAVGFSPEVVRLGIARADYRLFRVRLDLRPVRLAVGSVVTLVPYVGAELGSLMGEGVASARFPQTARESRAWLALAEGVSFEVALFEPIYLMASMELREPLRRYQFVFEVPDVSSAQVPPAELGVNAGAAVRFW